MEIRSFRVAIPQASLDDLRDRLDRTRWTSDIPGDGPDSGPDSGGYGMDLDWVRRLAGYWPSRWWAIRWPTPWAYWACCWPR